MQTIDAQTEQQTYLGAVNHTYGIGDLTFRYGLEAGTSTSRRRRVSTSTLGRRRLPFPLATTTDSRRSRT